MSIICKGDGECLDSNNYSKKPNVICDHSCIPIKCKNYILCSYQIPEMYIGCMGGKGLCRNCLESFGTWGTMPGGNIGKGILEITNNISCPVCNKDKTCISQPYCNHSLCVECFKECYGYNWKYDVKQPKFPYSEDIELEYEDVELIEDIKNFENKYPLMKIYNKEWDKWRDNEMVEYSKIKNTFMICPICHITKEIKYNQIIENKEIIKKSFRILKKHWLMVKYKDNEDNNIKDK